MSPIELCPEQFITAETCKKRFCSYRNKKGNCSLDFEPENKEYEIGAIAETLQVSRQRVWRIYDAAISKLKSKTTSLETI